MQDQMSRHLSRPPPDYKDQRRSVTSLPPTQFPGPSVGSSPTSMCTGLMSTAHGARLSLPAGTQNLGLYGTLPCNQPGSYGHQRDSGQALASPSHSAVLPRPPALGPSGGSATGSQQSRPSLAPGLANLPSQRMPSAAATSSPQASNWAIQETADTLDSLKPTGGCPPAGSPSAYAPTRTLQQALGGQPFLPRAGAPPGQLPTSVHVRPLSQASPALNKAALGPLGGPTLRSGPPGTYGTPTTSQPRTGPSQPLDLAPGTFPSPSHGARAFPAGEQVGGELAFDFLGPEQDGLGPGLSSDADFIECLLKTEPGTDDWMRDINLDEILGSSS